MFEEESHDTSTDIHSVMGSAKDLCFQLYAIMYYEVKGESLYWEKEKQLLNVKPNDNKANTKLFLYFKDIPKMSINKKVSFR